MWVDWTSFYSASGGSVGLSSTGVFVYTRYSFGAGEWDILGAVCLTGEWDMLGAVYRTGEWNMLGAVYLTGK